MFSKFSRFELKNQKVFLLGLLLCVYFCFHLLYGPRSLIHLYEVMQHNHNLEKEIGAIDVMEKSLEAKVVKLRPDTLDPDFLEERARIMLGYMKEDEIMVIDR